MKLWASKIRGPHNVGSWKCWLQNCGNKNLDSWLIIICTAYMYIINIYSFLSIKLPSWNILLSSSTFLVLYNILYTHSLSIKLPSWNICCPLVPPLCYIIYYILIPYQSNSPLGTFCCPLVPPCVITYIYTPSFVSMWIIVMLLTMTNVVYASEEFLCFLYYYYPINHLDVFSPPLRSNCHCFQWSPVLLLLSNKSRLF